MKAAFISYPHRGNKYLDMFHKYLVPLKRDGLLDTWTDREISPGSRIDAEIGKALSASHYYFPLVNADFIASGYCYDREFKRARYLERKGKLKIIPIIVEPCDWKNTPLKRYKALPLDGKPISEYSNPNKAFLIIIQELRKLLEAPEGNKPVPPKSTAREKATKPQKTATLEKTPTPDDPAGKYRPKVDFNMFTKLACIKETFQEIMHLLLNYMQELNTVRNIESMVVANTREEMNSMVVNRNMRNAEASLTVIFRPGQLTARGVHPQDKHIFYSIAAAGNIVENGFTLSHDDYSLFWTDGKSQKRLTTADMAQIIFGEWLEYVGITQHY